MRERTNETNEMNEMNIEFLSNTNIDFKPKQANLTIGTRRTSAKLACRDPFIMPLDGKYYLYKSEGGKLCVLVSDDLEHWNDPIVVFDPPVDFHGVKDLFWAPECHFYKGHFYIFTSVYSSRFNHRTISVYRSDDPLGPFVDIADGAISPRDWDAIDGTLYIDKTGAPWLVFVHEWTSMPDGNGGMVAAKLSDDLTHLISEPRELFRARDAAWATAGVTDGPYMLRTDRALYMIWSNLCENGYCVGLARSNSGDIDGDFLQYDEPIYKLGLKPSFTIDGGHAMLFVDGGGKLRATMHGPNRPYHEAEHLLLFDVIEKDDTLEIVG